MNYAARLISNYALLKGICCLCASLLTMAVCSWLVIALPSFGNEPGAYKQLSVILNVPEACTIRHGIREHAKKVEVIGS